MKIQRDNIVVGGGDAQPINKFHRAAIDGYVDMLCDASKRDTNLANQDNGFTPTLLAAFNGHLDALRILVGRGGDPERTTQEGSSALHLAAARNHLNCVSFLVNFGVNMWALDNELHTAKDVAAMEHRKEILNYLDQMMAKQSALNTKQVQKLKEKAKQAAEKRLKQMRKAQLKAIKLIEKDEKFLIKLSHNRRLLKSAHSISDIKLVGRGTRVAQFINNHHATNPTPLTTIPINQLNLCSKASTISQDSAYSSSSVSSSTYLSTNHHRPKYSDLVALSQSMRSSAASSVNSSKLAAKPQSSAAGGVSRKVKLKRMLLINSSSNSKGESINNGAANEQAAITNKLCNVQPPIKLKLSSTTASSSSSADDQAAAESTIKWPPAPTLTRAVSEPDFAGLAATIINSSSTATMMIGQVDKKETRSASRSSKLNSSSESEVDESQHKLLTKCLSQLKVRHQQSVTTRSSTNLAAKSSSDELIQHQLSAGQFPLRPSLIKQQQKAQANQQHKPATNQPAAAAAASFARNINNLSHNTSPIISSLDSIGSAGSLVQRNTSIVLHANSAPRCSNSTNDLNNNNNNNNTELVASNNHGTIESFLKQNGLLDLEQVLKREKIDLEALILLTEEDLKSIGVLLGPRRKLLRALENQKLLIQGSITKPMFVVVDTQL